MKIVITKEDFIEYIAFVKDQEAKELALIDALEALAPGNYCDAFVCAAYETKFLKLIQKILNDEFDDISYKLWEFDTMTTEEKTEQLKETPWLESWETLYDHLVENMTKEVL